MKTSLSFKIIGVLLLFSLILFAGLSFFSFTSFKSVLTESFIERAKATTRSLEAGISNKEDFKDKNKLLLIIQKNIWLDADIEDISFNVPEGDGMITYVSNDQSKVNQKSDPENKDSFKSDAFISKIIKNGSSETLKGITPVHISGELAGTIQIDFTLDSINKKIQTTIYSSLLIYVLIIISFLLLIYLFLKLVIINPLLKIEHGLQAITQNNFDYNVEIKSKDEIGYLAKVFNTMVGFVKESRAEIETKVEEQTKEINDKAKELKDQKSAILNILEDVEKEKNKAEELSAIVRDANEPIVSQDIEGKVLNWNHGAEDLYGYSKEEIEGKSISTIIPEEKLEEYEDIKRTVLTGAKIEYHQTIRKKKDGSLVDVAISVSPIKDSKGEVVGLSVITIDITKEKEIDRAKTEFVSLASHQLRTPLSSINWYTEMLLAGDAGEVNEEQKKYLQEVSEGSQRMVSLVNSLLNVSRLDLGTFIIEPEEINLEETSKSVIKELMPQILMKKLKVEEFYGENLPKFSADKKLLRIIFQNLLSNSVKYTPAESSVKIELLRMQKGEMFGGIEVKEDSISIKVSDSGIGIPDNQKNKIFSKLFRADNARESETEGTGLGLYIVKSIVDKSGGMIWFESEENKGTTFYIIFPQSGMKKKEGTKKLD
jgi:PAS domain S-box-containing protein